MTAVLRVLHSIASLRADHGGPSRSVPALVSALANSGVEARLHVADRDGKHFSLRGAGLVHDHGLWLPSNHASARSARRAGVPFVVSPRGMLEPWALAYKKWKKRTAWAIYQRADLALASAIHATSEAEAEAVREAGVRAPVAIIPNGVDTPEALPPRAPGPARRALFLSRVHPVKGLPLLVEAWDRIRPAGWELAIAGPDEGGHRAEVEALVQRSDLSRTVRFLGPVADADKWTLYRTADLFVLPTQSENFGIVIAEALAAGVPVLTTTAAPWRVLRDERLGWWADLNANAIATALADATARSPEQLAEMGARGRAYVDRELKWSGVAARMFSVYEWLVGRADRPDCVQEG